MKKTKQDHATKQAVLRESGSKATPSRLRVMEILERSAEPISIEQIESKTKRTMDRSTIYRILEAFSDSGLVRRVELGQDRAYYEIAERPHHHHLVCVSCQMIEDIDDCAVIADTKKILQKAKSFASIKNHSLEFFGVCKPCSKK